MEHHDALRKLVNTWESRCTVRRKFSIESSTKDADEFPRDLIYFMDHPKIDRLEERVKKDILAMAWLAYNERTIASEQKVANRAFNLIHDNFCGNYDLKKACLQSLVDEYWHTYLHTLAAQEVRSRCSLPDSLVFTESVTVRRLEDLLRDCTETWKRNIAVIVWAMVAEVSVNAYLNMIATSKNIQKNNSDLARFHNIDEYAHSKLFLEIVKPIFSGFTKSEKIYFSNLVLHAHEAFCAQDDTWWTLILNSIGIKSPEILLIESRSSTSNKFVRDFSSLEKIYEEIDLKSYSSDLCLT